MRCRRRVRPELGHAAVPGRRTRRRQHEYPKYLLHVLEHCRPVAVPHRSRRVLKGKAAHSFQARCAAGAASDLSWGTLQFLAGALAGASTNIQSIFSTFSSIADQSLFLTDLVEFLRVEPRIQSKKDALLAPRPIREGFVFDKVSFGYPGTQRVVLDRLDLTIEPGDRAALIGENGQGKTTIVKLLTRLYDPTSGRILLDGADLRDYSIEDLHRQIGVI